MLVVFVLILIGVFLLQQKPNKTKVPTTTTTTQLAQSAATAPPARQDSLAISAGPTWIHLQSPQSLTLDTSSLSSQSGVAVSLELFPKIESRSEFQVIMKYGLKSLPIASSPPIDLTQLVKDSTGSPRLDFEISEAAPPATAISQPTPTSFIQIPYCSPDCSGVYPMLAVFVKGSQIIGTALTEIALEPSSPATNPLNFAFVVQAPFTGNAKNDLNSLSLLVSAVSSVPSANVTLNIPGIILQEAVAATSASTKSMLVQLTNWTQKPEHQITTSGFVPINFPQLSSSGLQSFIGQELTAGQIQAEQFLHHNFSSLGPIAVHGGLTKQTSTTIARLGVSKILLSDQYFVPFSEKFSLSKPFLL
ncbi:MAG: hypothetical protein HKL84_10655, partial [Acidimicrobiaceae bacterium]|nr:hypothetical protein [Acidimicrobiaceae bacterium]